VKENVQDRRFHPRWLCASLLKVTLVGEDFLRGPFPALVEDVSKTGLGVSMEEGLPPGSTVLISHEGRDVKGIVRRCTTDPDGMSHLGLEFCDYTWEESDPWPESRLNVPADILYGK
jgi:hypothetical protein